MKFVRAVAVVIALLLPSSVGASPFAFFVTENGELGVTFGQQVPFETSGELRDTPFTFGAFIVDGSADLVSGPLVNLDIDAVNGLTTYSYGAGLLQLTMSAREGGCCHPNVTGTFVAETLPFSFVVCEGCDGRTGGGDSPDFEIPLGAGLFDANLADLFHIVPHTQGGFIDFGLDEILGGPLSDKRLGGDHRGFARLEIEVVAPEPALSALMLLGGAGWLARRKSRRA